jgi:tRNA (mo5U34)-methyltransferase
MMDFDDFFIAIGSSPLGPYASAFRDSLNRHWEADSHGNARKWSQQAAALPDISTDISDLQSGTLAIGTESGLLAATPDQTRVVDRFREQLMQFRPWRKGPLSLFGQFIDTEWRSDWKWDRILPHIQPLENRTILDVGCGNGYHCFRMRGEGARFVLGVDPTRLFMMQFQIIKKYLPDEPVFFLPLKGEQLPRPLSVFDTVFSLGVLYHRKAPIEHLTELRDCLVPGGELVLESLIIDAEDASVLVPEDRYAQMRNVWNIPSPSVLTDWLKQAGFVNIRLVDINQTPLQEQRATDWMVFQSLSDFLDPDDSSRTVEGYPAPCRAILVAEKPKTTGASDE